MANRRNERRINPGKKARFINDTTLRELFLSLSQWFSEPPRKLIYGVASSNRARFLGPEIRTSRRGPESRPFRTLLTSSRVPRRLWRTSHQKFDFEDGKKETYSLSFCLFLSSMETLKPCIWNVSCIHPLGYKLSIQSFVRSILPFANWKQNPKKSSHELNFWR